jgi:hypothetical protein
MELKGKPLSLGAKLLAIAIVLAALTSKALGFAPGLVIREAIEVAAFITLLFAPVDVSLWLENIFQKRPPQGGGAA